MLTKICKHNTLSPIAVSTGFVVYLLDKLEVPIQSGITSDWEIKDVHNPVLLPEGTSLFTAWNHAQLN